MPMNRELPPLNALRAFEAAARLQSISRAAEELHVTHGAVSRQIRVLEEQLGCALFVKSGRGVKLTDAGVRLRDAAADAFEQLRQTCRTIRRQSRDAPFTLACPGSLLARWFIPRLDRLNRDLPGLHLQIAATDHALDPLRSDVHASLCFAEPPWPAGVQVFELSAERIGPVVSPRYPRYAALIRTAPTALLDEPLLHTTSRPQAWPQWAAAQRLDADTLRMGQGFTHLYYLLEAAHAGLGVAIAPLPLVADDLAAGHLVAPWGFVETPGCLSLWVPGRSPDSRVPALVEWLQRELNPATPPV